jgi:putative restriction endonuclease
MADPSAKIEALGYYAKKLQRLRVDRAHGVAPHKPILLLAVMELFERRAIVENRIDLSPELNQTFLKYWSYLGSACHNPDISRPYFHMKSGKFWHLVPRPGFETVLSAQIKLKTMAEVQQAIAYAYIDEDLFDFWQNPTYRESLLAVLVGRWFPGRLSEIAQISQTDEFQDPPGYFREAYAMYMDRMKKAQC